MKKTLLSFLISLCWLGVIGAQEAPTRLLSSAELPDDYTTSAYDKYLNSLERNQVQPSFNKNRTEQDQFYLETNYAIDELLRSGYVLFNDPVGNYVNEVLEVVVAANSELVSNHPRAYILKSTEVNAFAFDQGLIFITLGLLAQLEDEAQLALILAHELVHIQERHSLDGFLEDNKIDKIVSERKKVDAQQFDLATVEKNRYSREQEIEADEKGLSFFLKTDYSISSLLRVLEILRYAYLPYDDIPFEFAFLEKLNIHIPENHLLEELNEIKPEEEDEEQSSHPALTRRASLLRQRLSGNYDTNRQTYLVSKERFEDCRKRARLELPFLFLEDQALSEAVYVAFLQSTLYEETELTEEAVGKALYGWAKFKNHDSVESLSSAPYTDVEGQSHQLFYLLDVLNGEEMNILAIAYNYHRYLKHPENTSLRALIVDLFAELYLVHGVKSLDYFTALPEPLSSDAAAPKTEEGSNKIDKIIRQRTEEEYAWQKIAFAGYLGDTVWRNIAYEGFEDGRERAEEVTFLESSNSRGQSMGSKITRDLERNGYSLDVEKVVLVNPVYLQLSKRKKEYEIGYLESDENKSIFLDIMTSSAALHGVDLDILDVQNLASSDVSLLNDITVANTWIQNQLDADEFLYQAYNADAIQAFSEKHRTPYLMTAIVISNEQASALGRFLNRRSDSLLFLVLFDMRNGRRAFLKADYFRYFMNESFLKAELYDVFEQLSRSNHDN